MREYFLYEIEANEKSLFPVGEWEEVDNLTSNINQSKDQEVVAYGEVESGKYIALYEY